MSSQPLPSLFPAGDGAPLSGGGTPATFFVTPAPGGGSQVAVSAGVLNNFVYSGATLAVADGNLVWIAVTVDGNGNPTNVTVSAGTAVPANTTTQGYSLIAQVAVSGGAVAVTPLAWNYSQVQLCGTAGTSTTYLWGGFGD